MNFYHHASIFIQADIAISYCGRVFFSLYTKLICLRATDLHREKVLQKYLSAICIEGILRKFLCPFFCNIAKKFVFLLIFV